MNYACSSPQSADTRSPKRPRREPSDVDDSDSELFTTRIPVTPGRSRPRRLVTPSTASSRTSPPSPSVGSMERRLARQHLELDGQGSPSADPPSADQFQAILTSMNSLPNYIKKLERKCRALQGALNGRIARIQQLEAALDCVKQEKESIERDNQKLKKENERLNRECGR